MSRVKTISVVVPTFNCADDLKCCLQSVRWVDEIVVVDMGSSDHTLKIAKNFKAKIYNRIPRDGNFDQNRKFGMEKATGDWILKLDSDERLSPGLQRGIQHLLKTDDGKFGGFNLYNRIFMLGHQIKHGFVRKDSHELRLIRQGKWHYTPYKFHQQITVDGKVGYLRGTYDHYNIKSVSDFLQKLDKYTEIDAKHYNYRVSPVVVFLTPHQVIIEIVPLARRIPRWSSWIHCLRHVCSL